MDNNHTSKSIILHLRTFLAKRYKRNKPKPEAWKELERRGYTIGRRHTGGWCIYNKDGQRCGKVFGTPDRLLTELDLFAELELKRIS